MTTVAKYETTSAPFAVFLETRVGGVATENANAFGLESSIASTLRWGSWQAYDGTVVDRLDARYYNNNFGRFWSVDPSGHANPGNPQSWNQYAYAGGDPVNFRDPTGRFSYNPNDPCGPFGVWMGEGCYDDSGGPGYGFSAYPNPPVLSYAGLGTGSPTGPLSGDGFGGAAALLKASIARVQADLAKPNCGGDFKNAAQTSQKAGTVGFSDQGELQFVTTPDGVIQQAPHSPGEGNYAPISRSINLNSQVNWVDPANTSALLNGSPYTYNALAAYANYLGVSSVSADQLMDMDVLHELSHYNGAIGNPDNVKVMQELWVDCIQ